MSEPETEQLGIEKTSSSAPKDENTLGIVDWACGFLDFDARPYQEAFLNGAENNPRSVCIWSRQTGKSTCVAIVALYKALTNNGHQIVIVSPSQNQSSETFYKIRQTVESIPQLMALVEGETSTTRILFKNGSRIIALPCGAEGRSIRGYTANVLVIEESGVIDSDVVAEVLMPMVAATRGQVIHIGTPKFKNHFYKVAYGPQTDYTLYHVDYTTAIRDNAYEQSFIDKQRLLMTKNQFNCEYGAKFMERANKLFDEELIKPLIKQIDFVKAPHQKKQYVLGVDLARLGEDESVLITIEIDPIKELNRVVRIDNFEHKRLTHAIGYIVDLDSKFNYSAIYIDETGMGAGPSDVLREKLGGKIYPVTFTLKNKQDMYSNLEMLFENKDIQLPNHNKLIFQLLDLDYEFTLSGQKKIHHSKGEHDDFPDALALACSHFMKCSANFFVTAL